MRKYAGLIWCLVFLTILEIAVFRNPKLYLLAPDGFIGQMVDLEQRLELRDKQKIEWLIIGDSQGRDGLRPPMLAKAAGIDAAAVFNLSISGGKPIDTLRILEKKLDELPNLKGVIIQVNEHQLNNYPLKKDSKFRYNATLSERWQAPGLAQKADLLLGWLSYGYGMRDVWQNLWKLYRLGKLPTRVSTPATYHWGLEPWTQGGTNFKTVNTARDTAQRWMENYQLQGPQTRALEQIIAMLEARKLEWLFIHLPRMPVFEQEMQKNYGQQQALFFSYLEKTAQQHQCRFWRDQRPLPAEAFRDVNHVNDKGALLLAQRYGKIFAELHKER